MRDHYLQQLRCRLIELGCPRRRLERMVHEVSDHRNDLMHALATENPNDSSVQAEAEIKLGNPITLADGLMKSFRQSTWCGRHSLFTFAFIPILTFPFLWAAILLAELWLEYGIGFAWNGEKLHALANHPALFHPWAEAAYAADQIAVGLVAWLFCWLAQRSGAGIRWMVITCFVCSVYGLFTYINIVPHHVFAGYITNLHHLRLNRGLIPLLIALAFCLHHRWQIQLARRTLVI